MFEYEYYDLPYYNGVYLDIESVPGGRKKKKSDKSKSGSSSKKSSKSKSRSGKKSKAASQKHTAKLEKIRKQTDELKRLSSELSSKDRKLREKMVKPGQIDTSVEKIDTLWADFYSTIIPVPEYGDAVQEMIPKKSKIYKGFHAIEGLSSNKKSSALKKYATSLLDYMLDYKLYKEDEIILKTETDFLDKTSVKAQSDAIKNGIKSLQRLNTKLKKFDFSHVEKLL